MKKYLFEQIPLTIPENKAEMQKIFMELLEKNEKSVISFINPEIFMQQQHYPVLNSYFKACTYNFIDGIGLIKAINHKLSTEYTTEDRYPGTDFFTYLPPDEQVKVYFYGAVSENLENAKNNIEKQFPNVRIVGMTDGYTKINGDTLIQKINDSGADILIVCKGCPLQELWIIESKDKLNAKIVFGNGGAIDFWSGSVKRAPKFMIKLGLEWLFRLISNFSFKRFRRQLKLFVFLKNYKKDKYEIAEL